MIPHSRPLFGKAFSDALIRIVESGHVAMDGETVLLEQEVARRIQKKCAVAVDSGSSAITLALRVLDRKAGGKRVGIPAYTCSSVLYAVLAAGWEPVCMDCGEDLRLLRDEALKQAVSFDAVIIVHPFGMVEPMAAEAWPCLMIEDIAQASGAILNGKPVGCFGDVAVTSFYATKPWGGAYGGILASDDQRFCERIQAMRDPDGAVQLDGYVGHHQLSDLHAGMANVRLKAADDELNAREALSYKMDAWFDGGEIAPVSGIHQGNHYRYIVRTAGAAGSFLNQLREYNVTAARPVTMPISRLLGTYAPGAERAWLDMLSLPMLVDISEPEFKQLKEAVKSCIN